MNQMTYAKTTAGLCVIALVTAMMMIWHANPFPNLVDRGVYHKRLIYAGHA